MLVRAAKCRQARKRPLAEDFKNGRRFCGAEGAAIFELGNKISKMNFSTKSETRPKSATFNFSQTPFLSQKMYSILVYLLFMALSSGIGSNAHLLTRTPFFLKRRFWCRNSGTLGPKFWPSITVQEKSESRKHATRSFYLLSRNLAESRNTLGDPPPRNFVH